MIKVVVDDFILSWLSSRKSFIRDIFLRGDTIFKSDMVSWRSSREILFATFSEDEDFTEFLKEHYPEVFL